MRKKVQWRDLTRVQRVAMLLASMLQVALTVTALRDIHQRSADEINGSKWMWTAAAFINFIGPTAYFMFGRKQGQAMNPAIE